MRILISIICLAVVLSLPACLKPESQDPAGKYLRHWENEYSMADDTLFVRALNDQRSQYLVEKHTGYHPKRNGVYQAKKFRVVRWTATWDRKTHVLSEGGLGKELLLTGDSLFLGVNAFEKLR